MAPTIINSVKYKNNLDDDRLLSLTSIETIIQINENNMKSSQPKNYRIQSRFIESNDHRNKNNHHHRKYLNSHHHHYRKHYHHCWYMLSTRLLSRLFLTKFSTLFLLLISCSTITMSNATIINHNSYDSSNHRQNTNNNDDNDNNSNIIHHSFNSKNNLTSLDMELIFESIFNEKNYQDAIEKMTRIWKLYNSNASLNSSTLSSTKMISSSQKVYKEQQIVPKYDLNVLKNRSRRWTSPNTTQSDHQSSNDQMIAEDSTVYHQDLNNNNKMKKQKNGIVDRNSETEEKANFIKLNISCSRCSRDERERSLRIEAIKMNILNKLNMEHPPNVSLKDLPKIPPVNLMLNKLNSMYNDDAGFIQEMPKYISKIVGNDYFGPLKQFDQDDEDEFFVHTSKSVVFAQKPPTDRIIDKDLRVQYFKFPTNILNNNVAKAYLWLYVKGWTNIKTNLFVTLYQVVRGSTSLEKFKTKRIANSVVRKGGWIPMRVEKLISKWMNNPEDNLGLVIHAYDPQGQKISVIHNDDVQADSALRPYIELLVENQSSINNNQSTAANSRPKRTIGLNCEDKSSEVRCCRYPLTVDFEQFGWDWIIAPKRYQANYCSGECPFVLMNQYPHTHLIQQIHMNAIGPCCSPRKMSSISMLYMDADYNVIYGIVPNMVVDRCGCS